MREDAEKDYQLALNKQRAARQQRGREPAEVARAQAALERAETDLQNSTIASPMDGIVLSRDVEVGDAVSSILVLGSQATLVMTLGDVGSVYVRGKVDEADIGKVYLGQPARIVVESFKDKKFDGKVTKISPLGVGEGQRHHLRGACLDRQPGRRAEGQHERQRRDHPRGEEGACCWCRSRRVIYDKDKQDLPGGARTRKARTASASVAATFGISNGVKAEVRRRDGPQGRRPGRPQ